MGAPAGVMPRPGWANLDSRLFFLVMSACNLLVFLFSLYAVIGRHSNALNSLRNLFFPKDLNISKYSNFPEHERLHYKEEARKMFYFGYESYMTYAFPEDELNPILCRGRGPDYANPSNININDVLGNYCLTLVDSVSTLAVMGNESEFKRAVQLVIDHVHFDKNSTVQVFEANIRLLGALLSTHLLITDTEKPLGDLTPEKGYDGELLHLAHDLASRLLVAFEGTPTGIPYPRVNLQNGVPHNTHNSTCTAGAGSLLLEFGILSRLLRDPVYESVARRSMRAIKDRRSCHTGLVGNVVDMQTGEWVGTMSGVGAGLDSYFEYLLKSYILFGDNEDFQVFQEAYTSIKKYGRRGRENCNTGQGDHPMYVNVDMDSGSMVNQWVDSLQAAFPAVQVLAGDVEEAICTHATHYSIWSKYGALPERFNWNLKAPDVAFYPLRPELVESTYFLYQATKNPFYLHVGKEIITSLNAHAKTHCGYATIHDVHDKSLEDRMESFFLSETCKYLYLLFDKDNVINVKHHDFLFTTEGHLIRLTSLLRQDAEEPKHASGASRSRTQESSSADEKTLKSRLQKLRHKVKAEKKPIVINQDPVSNFNTTYSFCSSIDDERKFGFPIKPNYFRQLQAFVGIE